MNPFTYNRTFTHWLKTGAAVLALAVLALPARAQVIWTGSGKTGSNARWTVGSNWSTGIVPNSSSASVSFDSTSKGTTVTLENTSEQVLALSLSGAKAYTLAAGSGNLTFANNSSSQLILQGTGSLTVSAPILMLNQLTISDTGSSSLVVSGGISGTNKNLIVSGVGTGAITISSTIATGTGSFTMSSAGSATLSGANTYTGPTTINSGTLIVGAANTLSSSTAVTVSSGGTLNANFSDLIGSLAGAGSVALGTGATLTVGNDNTSTTFTGALSGSGSLAKTGSGSLTLGGSSANTFTGTVTVSGGTLVLAKAAGIDSISGGCITINTGGTLLNSANNQIKDTTAMALAGGTWNTGGFSETLGALTLSGSSTLNLSNGASIIRFAASNSQTWSGMLSIMDWSGNSTSGGGMDQVYFDGSLTGLTTMQLADILFVNPTGFSPGSYGTKILPNGEIVPFIPVPEPATYVAGVTSLAVVGIAEWRRRRERDLRASWAGQATEFAEFDGLEV